MKTNNTELVFILDRSGSMAGLESDTIGGFNSMLAKQRDVPGQCQITTVLFDNEYELLHDRIDIRAVSPLNERQYFVRGSTALLDAIGRTIHKIGGVQKNTDKNYRAAKVMFVITTDGMENSSREFSYGKIKSLIERHKSRYGWEFVFLGANIDAVEVADSLGIARNRAQNYHSDSAGVALNFCVLSKAVAKFRVAEDTAELDDNWSAEIAEDYKQRGGKQ